MGLVIGLTGFSSSGKTQVANYFESRNGFRVIRLGKHLRELCTNDKAWEGSIEEYAEKYRFISLGEALINEIKEKQCEEEIVIIDSLRTVADYDFFRKNSEKFVLIMIIAERARRLEWISKRNRKGDAKNFWQLQSHDYWEMTYGINNLMILSDFFILNESNNEELYKKVEECIMKCQ